MPTVEFGAITWLAAPDQLISANGIPSVQAVGSGAAARAIVAASIPPSDRVGSIITTAGAVTITAYGIASSGTFGAVVVEVITEGARIRLVAIYLNGYAVAGYQKVYSGHISEQELMAASYQKRYSGYVLEHEFIAAARELVEA